MNFLITTPSLAPYDAVSNDVFFSKKYLEKLNFNVFLYSEYTSGTYCKKIISKRKLEDLLLSRETILIYHHSIYWQLGYDILDRALGLIFFKYHNITPSHFFIPKRFFINVVFPLPLEPITPNTSPSSIVKLIPFMEKPSP